MIWKKIGQIFKVNNTHSFLLSHAANPLPIQLDENIFRIFYSGRNVENKSSVGFIDGEFKSQMQLFDGANINKILILEK